MRLWVDTDMGFDDLWALLLLNHHNTSVDGVSLVAGNVPLVQVKRNAQAAIKAFDFDWPMYVGADRPLQREPETAERILGKYGMQSRGRYLPYDDFDPRPFNESSAIGGSNQATSVDAMAKWLSKEGSHQILALGPLTNVAQLCRQHPQATRNIKQITWLGGSAGRGNHSEYAEYNALADPEALAVVAQADISFRMIDLELCRQVSFNESDIPLLQGNNQHLVRDLLGGYLDIALQRGRQAMSIYDPLAALAVVNESLFTTSPASLEVHTINDSQYGRTKIQNIGNAPGRKFEIAIEIDAKAARHICLSSLVSA